MRRQTTAVIALLAVAGVAVAVAAAATSVKPYAVAVGGEYTLTPLFSVSDEVPVLGGATNAKYRMVGIPDGLGAYKLSSTRSVLYMNHEFAQRHSNGDLVISEPYVGGTKHRGAFVSKWLLDEDGDPISGKRAAGSNLFVGMMITVK